MVSLVVLSLTGLVLSAAPVDPALVEQANRLIAQLADANFQVREKAHAELDQMGVAIEPALRQGALSKDPEVRDVCQRLLTKVETQIRKNRLESFQADKEDRLDPPLPGWSRYKQLIGGSAANRKHYASIYAAGGSTLEEMERNPRDTSAINRWIDAFRVVLLTPGKEAELLAELDAYLLVLGDPRVPLDDAMYNRICSVLMIMPNRLLVLNSLRGEDAAKKLIRAVLIDRSTPKTLSKALQAAQGLGLPELRDWAIGLAKDSKQVGEIRSWAVLVLTQSNPKEARPVLESLLNDQTPVGTFKLGSTELKTELRDVALAALIQATGQKLESYPIPYFQAIPGLKGLPAPQKLGYPDGNIRETALKKWRDTPVKSAN